jgi:hypothetical protein
LDRTVLVVVFKSGQWSWVIYCTSMIISQCISEFAFFSLFLLIQSLTHLQDFFSPTTVCDDVINDGENRILWLFQSSHWFMFSPSTNITRQSLSCLHLFQKSCLCFFELLISLSMAGILLLTPIISHCYCRHCELWCYHCWGEQNLVTVF